MKSIHVVADNLPEAWEKAVIQCWDEGEAFPTEYDKDNDPNSRDVSAVIHIKNPFANPRIHKAFPGGPIDLEKYRSEVVYGVHDHWIAPEEGKWEYTYHERLFEYDLPNGSRIDQIAACVEMLKKAPHTRRAQVVTWQCWKDLGIGDPSCLQRFWFRCQKVTCPQCNGKGDIPHGTCHRCQGIGKIDKLNMNCHIRSNDAFKAGFMNMHAFTELQKEVADRVGVEVGEYIHVADSFHIYGSYFKEFEGFLDTVRERRLPIDEQWIDAWNKGEEPANEIFGQAKAAIEARKKIRTWDKRTCDEADWTEMFIEACDELLAEEDMPENKKKMVEQRKLELQGSNA